MDGRTVASCVLVALSVCLLILFLSFGEIAASADWLSAGTTIRVGFRIDGLASVLLLVGMVLGWRGSLPARGAMAGVILAGDPIILFAFWVLLGLTARAGRPAGALGSGTVLVAVLLLSLPMRSTGAWAELGVLLLVLGATARISGTLVGPSRHDVGIVGASGVYVVLRLMPLFVADPVRIVVLGGVGVVIVLTLAGLERWRMRIRRPGGDLVRPYDDLDRAVSRSASSILSGALEDLGNVVARIVIPRRRP
jgi:hypothetical protein